jgi:hypothetical protein
MRFPRKHLHSPFVRRRPAPFSFPGNSRYAAAHSGGRERALGLRSGDRPQRLCTVAQLALDARKDLGIPVGSMPVQL